MAKQNSKGASTKPSAPDKAAPLLGAGLDALSFGFAVFNKDLKLAASNRAFRELRSYPTTLCKPGTDIAELFRFNAERGDYGPGDIGAHVKSRLARARRRRSYELEYELAIGRILSIRYKPIGRGGLLLSYADVTERKRAEQELAESQDRLQALADYMQVALSSMSDGIYILDGDLNIVAFNQRYVDLLNFPKGLVREGGSVVDVVKFAAKRGDYGSQFDGDIDDVVAARLKQIKSNKQYSTENITPTGRIVEYRGSPIKGGGFITIMHDITERKRAEDELREAKQRAEDASLLAVEKARMLETLSTKLSKYLSPQVYDSIFSGKQEVKITSQRKKLTVFFSDIVGFTETTDNLEAEELSNLLNHYLTEMSKIALEHGGTIDKYVGDAILIFFGDPESRGVKEDVKACVQMAIAMQRRMRELEQEWQDIGLERPLHIRIGINTGFCTVGNFGSQDRMDYTIIGNEVNLASRLESNAELGGILMAHETYSLVKDIILTEEQPPLTVKGFDKPIVCYKVVGIYDDLAEKGRIVRHQTHGIQVFVDPDKLTGDDRSEAIEALKDALAKLEA